jgi:hypothetical protein
MVFSKSPQRIAPRAVSVNLDWRVQDKPFAALQK